LTLPGTIESRVRIHKGRQDCLFFLDASGSTWDMRDRFFALAQTLPSKHFNVELCSFDAEVYRLDIRRPEVIGGGGTSFSVLESWIQTQIQLGHRSKYPDVVIVLTDGLGDVVRPAHPERWHWLLTTSERNCIPRQCTVLRLSQYA
jgi:predicted metal-dependent peptidase